MPKRSNQVVLSAVRCSLQGPVVQVGGARHSICRFSLRYRLFHKGIPAYQPLGFLNKFLISTDGVQPD